MTIHFDITDYFRAHGKSPRGRGMWAFAILTGVDTWETVFAPSGMTFTDAGKWVKNYIKESGMHQDGIMEWVKVLG